MTVNEQLYAIKLIVPGLKAYGTRTQNNTSTNANSLRVYAFVIMNVETNRSIPLFNRKPVNLQLYSFRTVNIGVCRKL